MVGYGDDTVGCDGLVDLCRIQLQLYNLTCIQDISNDERSANGMALIAIL
jgi:hypothetical protein